MTESLNKNSKPPNPVESTQTGKNVISSFFAITPFIDYSTCFEQRSLIR